MQIINVQSNGTEINIFKIIDNFVPKHTTGCNGLNNPWSSNFSIIKSKHLNGKCILVNIAFNLKYCEIII